MPYMKDTAPAFGKQIKGNTVNMQFAVLSALGMFFVVDGHLNNSYLDIGGLFPYYSFHMPLFAFISGYFSALAARMIWERMQRRRRSAFWGRTWPIT